jgi:8-oxo-dGTP pyrophosphatase MutT (NUDIX family)
VSGYLEGDEEPRHRAAREVIEETGIEDARFLGMGRPIRSRDAGTAYVVHPFVFETRTRAVRLDWENVEARWISPDEIDALDAVPRLGDVMRAAIAGAQVRKG